LHPEFDADTARRIEAAGYSRLASEQVPPDFDGDTIEMLRAVYDYSVTSPERTFALCESVRYLVRSNTPGALVECGVLRGGSVLAMLLTLMQLDVRDRDIFLFDTFDDVPPPGPDDVDLFGAHASTYHELFEDFRPHGARWGRMSIPQLKCLFAETGYPTEHIHFVVGLVEDTLPEHAPNQVALLRLDTDYYDSTRHELEHLFPRVVSGGVLLVDDYGHFRGARKAVDEYLEGLAVAGTHLLLQRVDYAGRIAVVPSS
jgi:hypothetical protein